MYKQKYDPKIWRLTHSNLFKVILITLWILIANFIAYFMYLFLLYWV